MWHGWMEVSSLSSSPSWKSCQTVLMVLCPIPSRGRNTLSPISKPNTTISSDNTDHFYCHCYLCKYTTFVLYIKFWKQALPNISPLKLVMQKIAPPNISPWGMRKGNIFVICSWLITCYIRMGFTAAIHPNCWFLVWHLHFIKYSWISYDCNDRTQSEHVFQQAILYISAQCITDIKEISVW